MLLEKIRVFLGCLHYKYVRKGFFQIYSEYSQFLYKMMYVLPQITALYKIAQ